MNAYLLNFFISNLATQTESQAKKEFPDHTWGKLFSLGYVVDPECNVTQILTWENHTGRKLLSKEDGNKLAKALGVNLSDEMNGNNAEKKKCKSIFAVAKISPQEVTIQYNYEDNSPSKKIIL